jgi:ABC-type Mn2+/Zn2+ transport system ATPase subunit
VGSKQLLTSRLRLAGSGKSSLLAAMLGLMQQVAGTPDALRGKVAYVPQVSCLLEGHTCFSSVMVRNIPMTRQTPVIISCIVRIL